VVHGDHDPPWWTRTVQDHLGPRSDISLMRGKSGGHRDWQVTISKILYRAGKRGGKRDALSRRPENRPKEGAKHSEQSILKPEHFQISLIHEDDEAEGYISEPEPTIGKGIKIK